MYYTAALLLSLQLFENIDGGRWQHQGKRLLRGNISLAFQDYHIRRVCLHWLSCNGVAFEQRGHTAWV